MGSQFAKTFDLLRITSNQISYPESSPANTSQRQRPKQIQNKYPFWSTKNLTDNHGWMPIKIDYKKFKPLSQNLQVQHQRLQNHLKALQKKQNLLKEFKYYQDFDRIQHNADTNSATYDSQIQRTVFGHFCLSILMGRIMVVQSYGHRYSFSLWKKSSFKFYIITFPMMLLSNLLDQQMSPINHEYFRSTPADIRMYMSLAYGLDAYQYVNDMKYNFKYPEREQYHQVLDQVNKKTNDNKYFDAVRYFKRKYGITDPKPYLKNKQNSIIQTGV